jgi:enamine deaminase RidA (YjgF/YER057c/UK114 family)
LEGDEFLKDIRPASLMVEVSDFVKENCRVEIEAIAWKER